MCRELDACCSVSMRAVMNVAVAVAVAAAVAVAGLHRLAEDEGSTEATSPTPLSMMWRC